MKKLLSIVLCFVLMLTCTASSFAAVKQSDSTIENGFNFVENGFKFETLKASQKNGQIQKVRITNLETNEVEYLETYLIDGKYSYLATTKYGEIRTEPLVGDKENIAKITNLDTKEVKYLKIGDPITIKTVPVDSSLTLQSLPSLPFIFKPYRNFSGSNTASMASVAATASILLAISMGPAGLIPGAFLTMASTYVINQIETIYWQSIYSSASYQNGYYSQYQTWFYYDSAHNYYKEYTYFDTYRNQWQFK